MKEKKQWKNKLFFLMKINIKMSFVIEPMKNPFYETYFGLSFLYHFKSEGKFNISHKLCVVILITIPENKIHKIEHTKIY